MPLQRLIPRADVVGDGFVEAAFVVVHLAQQAVRLAALEDLAALGVGDVLLRRADDQLRELPAAAHFAEQVPLLQRTEIDVVFQQRHQVLEPAVVLFALVRRGGQQQERLAVMLLGDLLGQAVVERLFHPAGGVIHGAEAVGLVEDDEVPLAVFEEKALVFRPLETVDGGDGVRLERPDARVDGMEVAAEYLERFAELVLQLFLPLRGEAGGGDDEGALGLAALGERLPDHAAIVHAPGSSEGVG